MTTPVARRVCCGVASARGPHRARNEDAALPGPTWFVVADGMGGHTAGDVASRIVVDTFRTSRPVADTVADPADVRARIERVVSGANDAVRVEAFARAATGMGATVVGLTVATMPDGVVPVVFHVGDSRCYRLVAGELRLLTRDHSHVQELIDDGALTTAEARRHPLRNLVTRSIGPDPTVETTVTLLDPRPSRFLLATDGVAGVLDPRQIGRVLAAVDDPALAARRLVGLATDAGTVDDATALVVDLDVSAGPAPLATPARTDT